MTPNQSASTEALLAARDQIAATFENPFSTEQAVVFLVSITGEATEALRAADVYEALQLLAFLPLGWEQAGIGVFTTGWAAPLNAEGDVDGPPSEHPNRERVQLCTLLTTDFRCMSVASFEGQNRELHSEDATGSLADAMSATLVMMLRRRFVSDLNDV